jgi:hypothetical protein
LSISITSPVPSIKQIAIAQVIGMIGTVVLTPFIYVALWPAFAMVLEVSTIFLSTQSQSGLAAQKPCWLACDLPIILIFLILAFPIGAEMAGFQWIILRKWIKQPLLWITSCSLETTLFLWLIYYGWAQLFDLNNPLKNQLLDLIFGLKPGSFPYILSLALFGVLGGLVVGKLQSFWLSGSKRYYLLLNSITWSVLTPLLFLLFMLLLEIINLTG